MIYYYTALHGKNTDKHVETVFSHLKAANLKIKLSKCQFFKQHLNYLGHVISEQGIQPLLDKILAIKSLVKPTNIDELDHFLRITGYYRKFIPLFADILKSFNKLLKKDAKFQWATQCQSAFEHLKNAFYKTPIPQYPDIHKPYTLFTDASHYVLPVFTGT